MKVFVILFFIFIKPSFCQLSYSYNLGLNFINSSNNNKSQHEFDRSVIKSLNHELNIYYSFPNSFKYTYEFGLGINFFQVNSYFEGKIFSSDFISMQNSYYFETYSFLSPLIFTGVKYNIFKNGSVFLNVKLRADKIVNDKYVLHETASSKNFIIQNKNILEYTFNEYQLSTKIGIDYNWSKINGFRTGVFYNFNLFPFIIDSNDNEFAYLSTLGILVIKSFK